MGTRDIVQATARYVYAHPSEVGEIIRGAFGGKFGVPLAAFRWLIEELVKDLPVKSPSIEAAPPGLVLHGEVEKENNRVGFSTRLTVHEVVISRDEIRVRMQISEVCIVALGAERTLLSALLRSGTLRLDRVGDLVAELPDVPGFVVEAAGEYMSFDLLKVPRLARNPGLRRVAGWVSSLVSIGPIETEGDRLGVQLRTFPQGGDAAARSLGLVVRNRGFRRVKGVLRRISDAI